MKAIVVQINRHLKLFTSDAFKNRDTYRIPVVYDTFLNEFKLQLVLHNSLRCTCVQYIQYIKDFLTLHVQTF